MPSPPTPIPVLPGLDLAGLAEPLRHEIAAMPRLTRLVTRFLALTSVPDASASHIAEGLASDVTLAHWLLRQANSGYFNLSRPVTGLADALVVIGTAPLTRMVFAACTADLLRPRLHRYPGDGPTFWLHAFAVGTIARAIVQHVGDACGLVPDEALVAGLLHDVGKRALDPLLPRRGGPHAVALAEERAVTGRDHGAVSALLCVTWELPPIVADAVAHHHEPGDHRGAAMLALADSLAHHAGYGLPRRPGADELPMGAWAPLRASLDLPRDDLVHLLAGLAPVLEGLAEMLRLLGHNPLPADRDPRPQTSPAAAEPRERIPEHDRTPARGRERYRPSVRRRGGR